MVENLTPEELYDTVEKIIIEYSELGKKREAFHKFLKRMGGNDFLNRYKV